MSFNSEKPPSKLEVIVFDCLPSEESKSEGPEIFNRSSPDRSVRAREVMKRKRSPQYRGCQKDKNYIPHETWLQEIAGKAEQGIP